MSALLGGLEGNQSGLSSGTLGGSQIHVPEITPTPEANADSVQPRTESQMWNLRRFLRLYGGVTRDANGNILAGATVNSFSSSSFNLLGGTVAAISDANGNFAIPIYGNNIPTNAFLVAQKAGSPNVDGTTDNNIQPA